MNCHRCGHPYTLHDHYAGGQWCAAGCGCRQYKTPTVWRVLLRAFTDPQGERKRRPGRDECGVSPSVPAAAGQERPGRR